MPRAPIDLRLAGGALGALLLVVGLSSGFILQSYEQHTAPVAATPAPASPSPVAPTPAETPEPTPEPEPEPAAAPPETINQAGSLEVVVNKQRPLAPIDYAPTDLVTPTELSNPSSEQLRPEAAAALVELAADAQRQGLTLSLTSGYRSFAEQQSVYGQQVANKGQEQADLVSARPGHSEHQTGLAVDLARIDGQCTLAPCFGETAEGRWLAENAWRHGFLLRYPDDLTPVVGYAYEPWHFRYIGTELAAELHQQGIRSLEEYYQLPAAPNY